MRLSYPNAFIGYPAFKNRTESGFPLKTAAGMTGVTRTLTMMFFCFRSRSGPFEGTASVKPPALPEDIYFLRYVRTLYKIVISTSEPVIASDRRKRGNLY